MLDGMRRNAQSWMVKFLFGIIVLVFVFWGIGGFQGDEQAILATVNGDQILTRDFQERYQQRVNSLRQERGLDREEIREMDLKRQVFDEMVERKLLMDKASQMGVVLPSSQLRERIQQMEIFQDEDRTFDSQRYRAILQSSRMTPGEFEAAIRQDALIQRMTQLLGSPARPSTQEAREMFEFLNLQSQVNYLAFRAEEHAGQIEVSQEEIQDYYQKHQEEFQEPARMQMRYILLTPQELASYQEVPEEELKSYYERNKQDFREKDRIRARQILFELEEDVPVDLLQEAEEEMNQLMRRIQTEEISFSQAAREYSQGPAASEGGDLGWLERGESIPSFEEVAFSLEPGELSEPFRTNRGVHLIRVEERQEGEVKQFSEVRDEVEEIVARDRAARGVSEVLDDVLEEIFRGEDLQQAAQELELQTHASDWFTLESGPEELDLDREQRQVLFDLGPGQVTFEPLLLEEGYLLAEKTEYSESCMRDLEEVEEEIAERLGREQAANMARSRAQEALETVREGGDIPQELEDRIATSEPFGHEGRISELGQAPDLARDAFTAREGEWLPQVYDLEEAYLVAQVEEILRPSEEMWEQQKDFWFSRLAASRQQELFNSMVQSMRAQADIEIRSPEIMRY